MEIIDPGHEYELACLDEVSGWAEEFSRLRFVKRNAPPGHSGTTTQEVIRALIDRMIYVNRQENHRRKPIAIDCLREALRQLEMRAAEKRDDSAALVAIRDRCGHVECRRHAEGD